MKDHPTVSVCIPTYNRAEFLRSSIESVLTQTFEDFELVICDNASPDHTEEIVRSFKDRRLRYVRHDVNVGLARNLNECLRQAKGRYVTIFHDDDIMLEDNLRLKARVLEENLRVGLVHSRFHVIDEVGRIVEHDAGFDRERRSDLLERGQGFLLRTLREWNFVNAPSAMFRRECVERLGGIEERLSFTTDYEFWMRIALHYDVMFLATPLIKYRRHAGAGTGENTMIVDGQIVPDFRGLEQDYRAKRMIVRRARRMMTNWAEIERVVETHFKKELVTLVEWRLLEGGRRHHAQRAMVHLCGSFPWLLARTWVLRLVLKAFLSDRSVRTLKAVRRYLAGIAA